MENLADKLNREPPEVLRSLKLIGAIAGEFGYPVYAVGGFVRDIILGVEDFDLDIVVEGDGINFTRELSRKLNVGWTAHTRFKTATIHIPGEVKIKLDVATARQEIYDSPAALPRVSFGSIKDDLRRRDWDSRCSAAAGISASTAISQLKRKNCFEDASGPFPEAILWRERNLRRPRGDLMSSWDPALLLSISLAPATGFNFTRRSDPITTRESAAASSAVNSV